MTLIFKNKTVCDLLSYLKSSSYTMRERERVSRLACNREKLVNVHKSLIYVNRDTAVY